MAMSEKSIIQKAKAGDADAFCQIYDQYKDRLYRYAFYRLGNRQDAEDAVSECVLSAYRQLGQLRDVAAFPAWIFRILSGICAKMIAKQVERRKTVPFDAADERTGPSGLEAGWQERAAVPDHADAIALRLDLMQALEQLAADEKEIVLLALVAGFSSKEIAQMMGSRPGTVRSKQTRSLSKMRAFLEQ